MSSVGLLVGVGDGAAMPPSLGSLGGAGFTGSGVSVGWTTCCPPWCDIWILRGADWARANRSASILTRDCLGIIRLGVLCCRLAMV